MPEHPFDLVVVGTGTGLDVANWAADDGWTVAIVERGAIGGTCLNRGCIPSKLLIHSADVMETLRSSHKFGLHVDMSKVRVDWSAIVKRVTESVDGESREIEEALSASANPRLFHGEGKFVGANRFQVGNDVLVGKRFLLASGARPDIPDVPGLADVPYMTSTEALRRPTQPKSLIVLGGGYIAAELAHFYGALGTEVTIVHRNAVLLNRGEHEIARAFTDVYARRFRLVLDSEPVGVRRAGSEIEVDARHKKTRKTETLAAEALLVATGVRSNADTLDCAKTGVALDDRGYVKVNEFLETSAPGIWALGDATGHHMFKHAANHEAPYALQNMRTPDDRLAVDYHAMPHAVFAYPQIAGVGITEDDARKRREPYLVGRYRYRGTAMGHALEENEGFVKFIVHAETGKILGCHILGHEASTLIHEVLVAMKSGDGGIDNVRRAIHIHPALAEVVDRAANSLAEPE
ncbi:MAG: dihydrolipoyl dehydrogenase family protein [Thermoplasmatota archaeon]